MVCVVHELVVLAVFAVGAASARPACAAASARTAAPRQERDHIAAHPTRPPWFERAAQALARGPGDADRDLGRDLGAGADDPHAGPLRVRVLTLDGAPGAAHLTVEVLVEDRARERAPWLGTARTDARGVATFARVPEGRAHVLVTGDDAARAGLVPDPARYATLFEPFGGGPFPHLALEESLAADGARELELVLAAGRAATGRVEGLGDGPVSSALVWIASPGWLQFAPLDDAGAFTWWDPRPAPTAPFDPAAPSAGFLERLSIGVASAADLVTVAGHGVDGIRPSAAAPGVEAPTWRECAGLPAPPVGLPLVIELAARADLPPSSGERAPEPSVIGERAPEPSVIGERAPVRGASPAPDLGLSALIAEACRLHVAGAATPAQVLAAPLDPEVDAAAFALLRATQALLRAERGPGAACEARLRLIDEAEGSVRALLATASAAPLTEARRAALQVWIDALAPSEPGYARALADRARALRFPRRPPPRPPLAQDFAGAGVAAALETLRRRPSTTLGADLARWLDGGERWAERAAELGVALTAFEALAADPLRGAAVREGIVDFLLALGDLEDRTLAQESAARVASTLPVEELYGAWRDPLSAALAPLFPGRALNDARLALDAFANEPDAATTAPCGALLALARLRPAELAWWADEDPRLATFAAAARLLEGRAALDARGLPFAFLERLLR